MTPNDIEILIHCHVCQEPHPRANAPAVVGSLEMMRDAGLIEQRLGDNYHTTLRGQAHIEQLCCLPYPAIVYIDYKGDVILGAEE